MKKSLKLRFSESFLNACQEGNLGDWGKDTSAVLKKILEINPNAKFCYLDYVNNEITYRVE